MKKIIFLAILLCGIYFRFIGINWDQGYHLHPDERAIVMFTLPLQFPSSVKEFLSPQSSWNPNFFAYGSLPLYLLKLTGNTFSFIDHAYAEYEKINIVGRFIAATSDIGVLLVLFKIGAHLFSPWVGLLAMFFYAISILPIQLSHFYAVDTLLTFFIIFTLYHLIYFYEKPTLKRSMLVGISFGCALATKISGIVLFSSIALAIATDFILIFIKQPHKPKIYLPHVPTFLKHLLVYGTVIFSFALLSFFIFEPYAFIDFQQFWSHNMQQYAMTHDAFVYPYTLQYVGKIPYWYEVKNIFLFGQGPLLSSICIIGVLFGMHFVYKKRKGVKSGQEVILFAFFFSYTLIVGKFAVGFMRYMLPVYPLLCLFGALFFYKLLRIMPYKFFTIAIVVIFLLIWPLSFIHIYTQDNSRVTASSWIHANIPKKSYVAIEHWDDELPLYGTGDYSLITLPLYDPDTNDKWTDINKKLYLADYIIIASNRLYTPLQKLTDCSHLPPIRCYPITSTYYKKLFSGKLGFHKVAEFSTYPTIPFTHMPLIDQDADESFTVYDHPKVMIFAHERK